MKEGISCRGALLVFVGEEELKCTYAARALLPAQAMLWETRLGRSEAFCEPYGTNPEPDVRRTKVTCCITICFLGCILKWLYSVAKNILA